MLKQIGLILLIVGATFVGSYQVAKFFLEDARHRAFWLKVWTLLSVILGFAAWLILYNYG